MFVNFIDTYYDVIDELTKKTTQKKSRKTEINQEHRKIVEYIVKRDKEKAVNAMLEHLRKVKENIKRTAFGWRGECKGRSGAAFG